MVEYLVLVSTYKGEPDYGWFITVEADSARQACSKAARLRGVPSNGQIMRAVRADVVPEYETFKPAAVQVRKVQRVVSTCVPKGY